MTTETYQDLTFERKGQKRPTRPKLLKLTEVTMPHRNRKKTKLKVKERSQSNVRDRFYDDPAYTDDISHLALPLRRNSGPDKIEASGTFNKRKTTKDQINIQPYPKPRAAEPLPYPREHERDAGSSSSENGSHEYDKIKHGKSLEISHSKMEHSPKKREKRDRSAKQKRNLSLDNNLSNSLRRSLERSEPILKMASIDRKSLKQQPKSLVQRQNASESWNSCIAVTSDSSKATENDESFSGSVRKESKMQIGKKFLRGEIGIKSFNYYLLKEGLKSSKKFVEKKRNSLTWGSDSKKLQSRSEENIYEEIFFVDKSSDNDDHHNKYDDCELCMQECNKENCEYCFQDKKSKKHYFGSLGRHDKHPVYSDARKSEVIDDLAPSIPVNAHILEFQSYNPNNPGVYKIETTPVAFTSDYNPISSFEPISNTTSIIETNIKQISNYARPSIQSQYQQTFPSQSISAYQVPSIQQQQQQQQLVTQQLQQQQLRRVRDTRPNIQTTTTRITAKSSSSSDSLHHKYASKSEHQPIAITTIDSYEYNPRLVYGSNSRIGNGGNLQPSQIIYQEPKIYKSDSKASILSEYSIRSESSNRNFRCGEVSDSSLGDSMFSYSTQQKKYFGSSESCRFGFECRRCSLDGEKCSFSDTCRYECRNCDCSSSYFSSDFDDLNYNNPHRRSLNVGSGNTSHSNQRSYEYFNDAFDVKQSKYAQDFFKHVNDVKRSIYQAEIEGSSNKFLGNNNDPFAPIPSSKPSEMKKSLTSDMYGRQEKPAYHYPGEIILNRNTSGGSPYKSSTISHYASTQIFAPSSSSYVNSSSRSKDSGDYKYKSTTKDYRSMQNNISKSLDEQENSISSLKRISKSKQSEYNDRNLNDPEEKYKSLTKSLDKKLLYAQPYRKTKKDLQEDEIIHDRKTTTGAIPKLQSNESPIMHHRTQQQSKSHYAATVNNKISEYETPFTKTPSIKYAEPKSQTNYVSPRKSSRSIERSSGKTTKEGKIYQKSNIKSTAEIGRYLEKSQKEGQRRAKSLEKTLQKTPSDERNYNEISNKQTNRNIEESTLTKNKTDKKDKSEKIYKDNSSHSNQKKGAPKLIKTTQSLNEVVRDDVLDDEDDDVFYDAKGEESVSRSNSMRKNLKAVSPPCVPPTSPINSSNADINKNTITNDKNSSNKKDFKNSPTNQNLSISKNKTEKQDQNETQESTISKLPISSTQKINTPNTNLELNETKKEKPLKDNENLNTTTTTATTVTKSLDNKEQTPNEENINERKLQQLSIKDNSLKDTLKYAQDEILSPKDKSLNENTKNIKECNKSSKKEKTENEENSEQKSSSNNINSVQQHQQPKSTKDRSISEKAQQQQQLQQNNVSGKNIKQSPQKIHQINNEQNVDKQIDTQKNHNDKEKIPNNDKNQQNISTMNTNIENVAKQENENISIQNNNTITTTITTIISTDNNLPSTSKIESTIEKIPLKQIEVDIKSLPPPPSPIITTDEIKEVSDTNNVNNDNNIDTNSVTINTNATIASATITVTDTANITATNDNNTTTTSIIGTSVAIAATAAASTVIPIAVTTNLSADEEFSLTKTTTAVGNKLNRDQQSQESVNSHPKDLKSTTGDFGTLDTSELSTDESHLTKTSTAKSSNDFSSTDKIDISDLPLPALPPKKRRSKSRSYRDANFTHSQSTKGQPQQQQIQHSSRHSSFENLLDPKAQFIAKRRESLEISARNFNEKLEARKMHFHNMGHMRHSSATANSSKPTYLFGEKCYTTTNPNHLTTNPKKSNIIGSVVSDEIYLNKSGWVQVNSKRLEEENYYSHQNGIGSSNTIPHFKNTVRVIQIDNATRDKQPVYSVPKIAGSKIEELISRSEARRNNTQLQRTGYLKSGCKIVDSQLATILNERPGFLPVKTFMETESPPPVTPILSPPPAFQDTKSKYRNEKQNQIKAQINSSLSKQIYHPSQITVHHQPLRTNGNSTSGSKGMVFSRSFEYETRKPTSDYAEVFSKSFDSNLSDTKPSGIIGAIHRDRSPNFSTLTGNSPNYLTKKESSQSNISNQQSRDNSPKYQQIGYINPIAQSKTLVVSHTKELPPYNSSNIIPRKIEKPKTYSFDRNGRSRRAQFTRYNQTATMPVSRFRSFDQNINARLNSCDSGARSDLSNDELDNEEDNSSEFLTAAYQSQSNFRQQKQRSLTPDKYDSQGSQCSLRKQRSLTPENRSLTPEERRKKGSQASLSSRQNSSSRSNTLERKGKYDDKSLSASRSSSTSSSYSGGDHNELLPTHRRSTIRNAKAPEEYRIRRSRSLQLTERSPNRQIQRNGNHQSINIIRPSQQIRNANFPPTIRPSQIISDPMNTNATIISINSRTNSATIRNPNDNIDKSRSFDFDYNVGSVGNSGGVIVSSSVNSINQHITGGRLDFDKSRSFDEDYREQSNNLVKSYLTSETISGGGSTGVLGNLLKSGNRSAGGSGSSSSCGGGGLGGTGGGGGSGGSGSQQQLHQQTSPQNYGTRLCDHEMTYDMLRRTLDRSPIMDFSGRVSGSNIVGGPDYDIPQSMINRETINAGGNSELNFTSDRIYDHGMNLTKTSKRLNHSPSDSLYSIDRLHASRDSITPDSTEDRLRSEYGSIIYRQQSQRLSGQDRSNSAGGNLISGSSGLSGNTTALTSRGSYNISNNINNTNNTTTNTNNIKTLCEFYPNCGSINNSGSLKLRSKIPNIKHTRSKSNKYLHRNLSQRKNNLYNDNINNNNNNNNSNINNNNINYNRNNRRIHVSSSVNDLLQINSDDEQLYMNINKKMNARLKKSSVSSIPIIQQYQQQQHNSSNNEHYNSIGDFNNKQKQIYHDLKNRINTNISLHITEDIINNQKQQKSPIVLNKNINNGNNKIKPSPKLNKKNMPTTMIIDENQQTQQLKQQNKKLSPKNNLIGSIKIKPSINYNIGGINNNTNNIINNNNNNNYNNNNHIIQPKCNSTGNSPKYFKTDYKLSPTTLASTIIFFGDREMPVTRDSTPISSITSSPTAIPTQQQQHFYNTSGINNSNYNNKINNSGSSGVGCSSGISGCNTSSGFNIGGGITTTGIGNNRNNPIEYESGAKSLEYSGYCGKSMRFSGERPKTKLLDSNIHQFGKKRSISLPNIFLETKFSSSTLAEDVGDERDRFATSNLLNRYRAISSPSLNESSLENTNAKKSDVSPYTTTISVNGNNQNGVFYKFRKTFEHFKQCPPTSIHTSTSGTVTTATTINDNKNINNKYNNDNNIIGKNFTQKNLLEDKINIIPTIITATQGTTTNLLNNSNQLTTELNTNINNGGNSSNSSNGSFKNRFGASIWRNSQERRKTKFNRRDKCNSGDSGIQIEAENDENFIGNIGDDEDFEIDTNSIPNISVRRSNSARSTTITSNLSNGNCNVILSSESFRTPNKRNNMYYNNPQSGSASAKSKALKKVQNSENGSHKTSPKPKRSLSHPGLDQMTKYADDSDTDSISSHPDDKRPLFAEVLNQFTPAGPQELALEPGALVEIIRQDDGPWWYGKIKHDEIIEKILEPQQGWFPKDFVRLLNPFMQTSETENDFSQNQLNHKTSLTSVVEYNNTSVINCCDNNINSEDKNSSDSTITTTNTTTITNSNISSSQINSTFQELSQNNCNDNEKFIRDQLNIEQTSSLSSISSSSQQHQQQQQQHQDQQNSIISNSSSSQQSITLLEGNNFINNEQIIQNETNKINMESTSSSSCTINPFNIQHKNLVSNINENLRQNAIKELLETEINYVNLLSTLCLGYLKEMRKRIDIFSPDSLKIIFSNIEVVWEFQKTFLEALKKGVEKDSIAQTFINYQNGFSVYSTYCNSYPRALMELETYSSSKEAKCIFENIRVAQNLSHLPLSAHLLAPIQRICRYPLHLTEIVKHYPSKGGDIDINNEKLNKNDKNTNVNTGIIQSQLYNSGQSTIVCGNYCDNKENFEAALNVMKKVTENVNEGKRHSENLNRFQSSFENFQGPPIACHSTRFFMQTDATRISPNLWNNTYTLFLFDHQLIYCKKDILKRNHYMYKGRIFLDSCRILNLPDGKIFGVSLKNALRIYCETLNKWFDFCFRSSSRKLRFLSTLAIERQFCGTNLFVSELVGGNDPNEDDNLSDREYHSDYDTPTHNSETNLSSLNWKQNIFNNGSGGGNGGNNDQQIMIEKYYETLPKKSKKFKKHGISSTFGMNYQQYSNNSTAMNSNSHSNNNQNGSLGRRKIGSWFRKSKSTNTTPNQSPTHNPISNNPLTINTDNNLLHHTNSSPALDGGLLIETCKSVTNISTDAN